MQKGMNGIIKNKYHILEKRFMWHRLKTKKSIIWSDTFIWLISWCFLRTFVHHLWPSLDHFWRVLA